MPTLQTTKNMWRRAAPKDATSAWLWLLVITVLCLGAAVAQRGLLPWVGWLVAALIWLKARLVTVHYLEIADASPLFRRIVLTFISIAPVALIATAVMEA